MNERLKLSVFLIYIVFLIIDLVFHIVDLVCAFVEGDDFKIVNYSLFFKIFFGQVLNVSLSNSHIGDKKDLSPFQSHGDLFGEISFDSVDFHVTFEKVDEFFGNEEIVLVGDVQI